MFKKAVPLLLSAILLGGCTPSPTPAASVFLKQVPLQTTAKQVTIPDEVRKSHYDLSTELTADYFKTGEKKNQIFSPLSLWYALGVLREGATGETLQEIEGIMKLPQGFDSSKTIPDLSAALLNAIMEAFDAHTLMSTQALGSEKVREGLKETLLGPAQLYEKLRQRSSHPTSP